MLRILPSATATATYQRQCANGGPGPSDNVNISAEFDKRITENFGVGIASGYNINRIRVDKTHYGFDNVTVSAKYHVYTNATHEFIASIGVIRELGGTGTANVGAGRFGSTTPTVYFGKGLGDLPIGPLRTLAVTGTFGRQISDVPLKTSIGTDPSSGLPVVNYNQGSNDSWVVGMTIQCSIPYLQTQVKDYGLPQWRGRLTPLIEVAWSSPATRPSTGGTQFTVAPGVAYSGDSWQFAVVAIIPGNKQTGSNIGVIAQFHLYFDDIFPNSLGKPLF